VADESGMSFRQARFEVSGRDAERLSDTLMEAGALSVDVTDADAGTPDECAVFDEPGEASRSWRRCVLTALFAEEADVAGAVKDACAAIGSDAPTDLVVDVVADQDWVRLTRSQFKPIRITPSLWIIPSWEDAPDPDAINLRLDPGVAFGTGSHPTTRLCLHWLAEQRPADVEVLDYGCGSGILAIAALRLGAKSAVGVDIDPQALVAARDNATQNSVSARFHAPGSEPPGPYRIVLANILANPLMALAPLLASRTEAGGSIVLSGILEDQAREVAATYARWFDMSVPLFEEGWSLVVGRRRAAEITP
jgi:ribosomal protein L11 methyltransferase